MIDWFIILTPFVLLPIALYFFFLGCTGEITNVVQVKGVFVVTFYMSASRVEGAQISEHDFRFRILDSSQNEIATSTVNFELLMKEKEGFGGKASRYSYQFSYFFQPDSTSLSCQVIDTFDQETLVSDGHTCKQDYLLHETYLIIFDADVSDDEIVPNREFDFCTPDKL